MNLHPRSAPSIFGASLALVASVGLLVACSRPTAVPTGANYEPGPNYTFEPPPQPGDQGYPPKTAPTNPLPDSYPQPGEAITSTLPGGTVTDTLPIETPTMAITGTAAITGTP